MMWRLISIPVLLILGVMFIGVYLAPDDISACDEIMPAGNCRSADAIVVISGGDTIARTDEAIKLYQAGWAPMIIFSGAAADKDSPSNASVMRDHAIKLGVPAESTVIEDQSETTRQNAEQVKSQLVISGSKRVILVTSGYHMRRASLEFSKQLGDGVEVVRHPVASDKQWGPFWWAKPNGWWMAINELVKISLFYVGGTR